MVMVELPGEGRVYSGQRRVRLGDASPAGRLRLDALARYLHDVASDDTRDVQLDGATTWVVRRAVIQVAQFPIYGEVLTLQTWCSGTGGRWAERRVSVRGDEAGAVDAATIWVHVDGDGRPSLLPAHFHEVYGPATGGRKVSARLSHPDRPLELPVNPWPVRFIDMDLMGHVNNAAYWAIVEEQLVRRRDLRAPLRAEIEFRDGVAIGQSCDVALLDRADGLTVWVLVGETLAASMTVTAATKDQT